MRVRGSLRRRLRRSEEGAIAVFVGLLAVVLFMAAALSVDIGLQINRKHQLLATLDAAAQGGASELPGSTVDATATALEFARAHDSTATGALEPTVDFWCIVASTSSGSTYSVDTSQLPSTCYPGTAPYTPGLTYKTTGRKVSCSSKLCAIPCVTPVPNNGTPKFSCNTIRVFQGRDVPFAFGPAGGIDEGSTGNLTSVACKGSCGTVAPNPMDVAFVADRTLSMSSTDVKAMVKGIKDTLVTMTPSQQYVALGTIGRSVATSTDQGASCSGASGANPSADITTGQWLPVSFSNNYLSGSVLNTNAPLVKQIDCLLSQTSADVGTQLAAPLKSAARYLLGSTPNNLSGLPVRTETPQKVIIFETDGQPNERISQMGGTSGSTSLTDAADPFVSQMHINPTGVTTTQADTSVKVDTVTTVTHNKTITHTYDGGGLACNNFLSVAAAAKAAGIRVITIAYNMNGLRCFDWDGTYGPYGQNGYENRTNYTASDVTVNGPEANTSTKKYKTRTITKWVKGTSSSYVLNVLAAAAGTSTTTAVAETDCSTTAEISTENSDGDDFFCAVSGSSMAPIFKTALSQVAKGIKLLNLP